MTAFNNRAFCISSCFFMIGFAACMGSGGQALAQEPARTATQDQQPNPAPAGAQKVEALKIAFLSQKLNLSPREAEKFWPLYNNYQQDMRQLAKERNQYETNNKTSGDAGQSLNEEFNFRQRALQIQQKYKDQFLGVLPPRKVLNLYKSEGDFNKRLIRELKDRGGMQGMTNMPGNRQFKEEQRPQRMEQRPRQMEQRPPVRMEQRPPASQPHPAMDGGRRKF